MNKLAKYYSLWSDRISDWFYYQLLIAKLNTKLGLLFFVLAGLSVAYIGSKLGFFFSLLIFVAVGSGVFVFSCFIRPKIGFFTAFVLPCIFFPLQRKVGQDLPFGALVQGAVILTLVIILFKKIALKDTSFAFLRNNVTYAFIVLILYNFLQALNPNLSGLTGFYFILRGNAVLFCLYVVGLYLSQDIKFVKQLFYVWIGLALICALYACYQEWFGLLEFEKNWIHADQLRFNRIFVQGQYRKFSLLSDPTAFGIFMSGSAIATLILTLIPKNIYIKLLLLMIVIFLLLGVGYSGTRTAYAMLPAGLVIFLLMTITSRNTLILSVMLSLTLGFLIFGPIYGNATINRFRSTFDTEDQSLNIRDVNREAIQPYIYEHPIGGGVLTTGDAGLKFNPNHYLAGFPPDNGYLKIALETGWVGLLIFLIFIFVILREGIKNYYATKDSTIKIYQLAFIAFIFSISIALYAQTVTTQIPLSTIFWPIIGILANLKHHDKK